MLIGALAINIVRRTWDNLQGILVAGLAACTASAGMAVFRVVLKHVTGAPAIRVPHLTARFLGTGYGTRSMRATCPGNGFVVCEYGGNSPKAPNTFCVGSSAHFRFHVAGASALALLLIDPGSILLTYQ